MPNKVAPATPVTGPDPREALALRIRSLKGHDTLFLKLRDLFPECAFQIEDAPQLFPLRCLVDHCPRNMRCMDRLVARLKFVFDTWPETELVMLYFSWQDRPGSQRAGLFWRDMREPRCITFNRTSWEMLKRQGTVYAWHLPSELFLAAS